MKKNILVTGGLGYIGSHTCIELISSGYNPVIIDDLSNCKQSVHTRLQTITQKNDIPFIQGNVSDESIVNDIFETYSPYAVMHFAGSKAVGESVEQPLKYYRNNIESTLALLQAMQTYNVKNFIFSSSATVYGTENTPPLTENMITGNVTNPYGRTKYIIEEILKDLQISDDKLSIIILRYFNPVGADASGMIGEDPNGIPNNLMPYISKVASGELPELKIFGNDYPTPDGTGVRDYIHVTDLARGHVASLEKKGDEPGLHIYNLGTGKGFSVMDVLKSYEEVSGRNIPYSIAKRREGDLAESYADVQKAKNELDWTASKNIQDMVADSWNWIKSGNND